MLLKVLELQNPTSRDQEYKSPILLPRTVIIGNAIRYVKAVDFDRNLVDYGIILHLKFKRILLGRNIRMQDFLITDLAPLLFHKTYFYRRLLIVAIIPPPLGENFTFATER